MNLAGLVSALVALAKLAPIGVEIADKFETAWRNHRLTRQREKISDAISDVTSAPWECPAACPHRGLRQPAEPRG